MKKECVAIGDNIIVVLFLNEEGLVCKFHVWSNGRKRRPYLFPYPVTKEQAMVQAYIIRDG